METRNSRRAANTDRRPRPRAPLAPSVSLHVAVVASRAFADLVDFSDVRKFDAWCRILGVTRNQLAHAVGTVGNGSQAVREYFRRRPQ